jgi:hypothetical protein
MAVYYEAYEHLESGFIMAASIYEFFVSSLPMDSLLNRHLNWFPWMLVSSKPSGNLTRIGALDWNLSFYRRPRFHSSRFRQLFNLPRKEARATERGP